MGDEPYYADAQVTLHHGDCLEITDWLEADVLVTDPPYGMRFVSGSRTRTPNAGPIEGDRDTAARDEVLSKWGGSGRLCCSARGGYRRLPGRGPGSCGGNVEEALAWVI